MKEFAQHQKPKHAIVLALKKAGHTGITIRRNESGWWFRSRHQDYFVFLHIKMREAAKEALKHKL